jgi:DNA polymerase III epsilon subunit-like protein
MVVTHRFVFDIESTGLHRESDRIVSIAAIRVPDAAHGIEEEKFYEEVNPLRSVSKGAARVHGLSDEHLLTKPIWAVVGPRFWAWILKHQNVGDEICLIGHNARSFDVPMLSFELARLSNLRPAKGPFYLVDTLTICRTVIS